MLYDVDMRPLTTDLTKLDARPYFLWDEDVTVAELRDILANGPSDVRDRYLGKMLREANDRDVWRFVSPELVAEALPRIQRIVGRRAGFWNFLIDGWRGDGALR